MCFIWSVLKYEVWCFHRSSQRSHGAALSDSPCSHSTVTFTSSCGPAPVRTSLFSVLTAASFLFSQVLGFEVDSINSVQFSNHTGWLSAFKLPFCEKTEWLLFSFTKTHSVTLVAAPDNVRKNSCRINVCTLCGRGKACLSALSVVGHFPL